jgi:cardiolipin synthase (CMP-forming)
MVGLGETLLWLAALLTMVTGYDYLRAGLKHMDADDPPTVKAVGGAE